MQHERVRTTQNILALLLLATALILGGGGSPAPLPEAMLQVLGFAALAAWVGFSRAVPVPTRPALIIVAMMIGLPLLQLIPLPPALWQALPAREPERAALALIGAESSWRPWTVAPSRTLAAFLALTTPAIVLVMVGALGRPGRAMVVGTIAGVALLSLVVGAGQMSAGESNAFRFYVRDAGYLNGFQANHNSAADVLLIGMVAFAAVVRDWVERPRRPALLGERGSRASTLSVPYRLGIVAAGCGLLALGVILTASRAGTLLLFVPVIAVLAIVWPWLRLPRRTLIRAGAAAVVVLLLAAYLLATNGVIAKVVARYDFAGEFRPQLWRDALYAARQYLPVGAGLGAFVPVFIAVERLEVVDATLPNRAHNDFIELAIEAGIPGLIVLAIAAAIIGRLLWKGLREPPAGSLGQVYFAGAAFCVIALHSQVDYPLRSMSLACLAAAAGGLLMPLRRGKILASKGIA